MVLPLKETFISVLFDQGIFFQQDNFVFPLLTLIAWKGTFSSERVFGGGEGRVVFVTEHTCDDGKLTLK